MLRKFQFYFIVLKKVFYDWANNTKVNGMYYLRKGVTTGLVKLIWSGWMIGMLCFGCYLVLLLWERFLYSPWRITIHDPMDVDHVLFPAVTICHPQSVIDYKIPTFMDRIKLPPNFNATEIAEKLIVLSMFTEYQWEEPNMEDIKLIDEVLKINNISVSTAINELGSTCTDFIKNCSWNSIDVPCFPDDGTVFFQDSYSFLGACCSFNYFPEQGDNKYFKTNKIGNEGGLSVILTGAPQISDGKSGALYSDGLVVLIHHPNDFPTQYIPMMLIEQRRELFVEVTANMVNCDNDVLKLPIEARNCLHNDDIGGALYREPACILECQRNKIYELCHCHPYQLPRSTNISENLPMRVCTPIDADCVVKNMLLFKKLECSHCLPSCDDIIYIANPLKINLMDHHFATKKKYESILSPKEEMVVNVYWGNQRVQVNRKIIMITWVQILANLGGVFNLVFGMSIISLLEIIYVIVVRFQYQYKKQERLQNQLDQKAASQRQNKKHFPRRLEW